MKNSRKELENILEELEKRKGKKYFHWVKDYWTTRGNSLDFESHKYLVQIYEDQHPDITYKKSAQAGVTERMISEAIWLPDTFKENSLYLFPTSSTVSDLVQERVDEPINNNPYLSEVSGRSKKIIGKQADKVNMKRMSKGFIYFRSANRETQIISVPADVIFVDELDRMPVRNIPFFDKRLGHSNRKWKRFGSTPTIPGYGIDARFELSDQHYYNIKCSHCNEWQVLDFWENVDVDNICIRCSKCKQIIIPWQCEGKWIAENPESDTRGYHISQLYSSRLDLKALITNSKKTAEYEVQQFYNQDLGLPYEPKGAKLLESDFHAATRDFIIPWKPRIDEEETFMGVDIGKVLHIVIATKERICFIGERKDFEDLDKLMVEYNIRTCVVDALPETRKASEFANRFNGRVYLCYYSGFSEIKENRWFKTDKQKVNTDRTLSLDKSTNIIKQQKIQLPKNLDSVPDFKNHCKALTRIIQTDKNGNLIPVYLQVGPDHYRHSFNYENLAKEIFYNTTEVEFFVV